MKNQRTGWIVVMLVLGSCSDQSPPPTSTTTSAVTIQNGLVTNGLWENGLWENGLWENGLWENGLWENGLWENGLWENGLWENGLWENGLWENGLWENGLWENGYRQTELETNPYAGKLLQYIYACAMPNDRQYDTTLDPNGAAVALSGLIGLGINADGSGWWESGKCDETCQRWVSACVLARTNAYGVHVPISLRAPVGSPARILKALGQDPVTGAVLDTTEQTFTLREGAYYGNIFATTPTTAAPAGGSGPATGPIQNTPQYYACAGPASNIPEITKRFCSSEGDNDIIDVVGVCLTLGQSPGACAGEDLTSGAMRDCFTSAIATAPRTEYNQVLTVYLSQPMAVCGNGVCEQGEDTTTCQADCHPGTWAKSMDIKDAYWFLDTSLESHETKVATDPNDNSIVVAEMVYTPATLDLDGDADPSNHPLASIPLANNLVLLKFDADGNYLWGTRTAAPFSPNGPVVSTVAVGPDGSIVVAGWKAVGPTIWLAKFTAAGDQVTQGWPIEVGADREPGSVAIALDRGGNVVLGSTIDSPNFVPVLFGAHSLVPLEPGQTGFAAKLWSDGSLHAGGLAEWAVFVGAGGQLAVDPDGNALVPYEGHITKLAAADGSTLWSLDMSAYNDGQFNVFPRVATDGSGNVYASGGLSGNRMLQKFSKTGAFVWETTYTQQCPDGRTSCSVGDLGEAGGAFLSVDPSGSTVIIGGAMFGGISAGARGMVDLGAGTFDPYASADLFVAAYATADTLGAGEHRLRWAKHIPMILDSKLAGYAVDGRGHVVVAGQFSGSMLLDDQLLVNSVPEGTKDDMYLGSFGGASPTDTTPPTIENLPSSFDVQATSSAGATAWYMPPTAKDDQGTGATVACTPVSSSLFPIGNTTVTCTATDAAGNAASKAFVIHVLDKMGPAWSATTDVTVEATGPGGAVAAYATPTATDQIDGLRPVTCSPASGATFPVGSSAVTCSATDASNNTSHTTLTVLVRDTTPPVLTLPTSPVVATATSAAGAAVTYVATANDLVDGPITPVCTRASGSVFPLGNSTVTCTATDAHHNVATGTFVVSVRVAWSGILQPINADNSSVFHLGSTVPVKFALTGASAGITNLWATLSLAKITNAVEGTVSEAVSTSAADIGNAFRYDAAGHQYIFNLATNGLSKGTWRLVIDFHDGVLHTVDISLK